jgi:hypothetical protein
MSCGTSDSGEPLSYRHFKSREVGLTHKRLAKRRITPHKSPSIYQSNLNSQEVRFEETELVGLRISHIRTSGTLSQAEGARMPTFNHHAESVSGRFGMHSMPAKVLRTKHWRRG